MRIWPFLLVVLPAAAFSDAEPVPGHPAVAVFDFKSEWSVDYHVQVTNAGRAFAALLAHDLAVFDPLTVVDRESVARLQDHRKIALGDPVTPADAKEIGQQLGASALVSGQLLRNGDELIVAAKVVSSQTGETQGTSVKGGSEMALADLISQLSEQVGQIVLHQQGVKEVAWEPATIAGKSESDSAIVPGTPREDIASIASIDRRVIKAGLAAFPLSPGVHEVGIFYYEGNQELEKSVTFDVKPGASYEVVYDGAAAKGKRPWIRDQKTHQPVEVLKGLPPVRDYDHVPVPLGATNLYPYYTGINSGIQSSSPQSGSGPGRSGGGGHK
jgi:TolB-like protein